MIEAFGNIWQNQSKYDAIVITTNGFVKKNGEAVMGRGIALDAKTKYPNFPKHLGQIIQEYGPDMVWIFTFDQWNGEEAYEDVFFNLPVKPAFGPNGIPGWRAKADIALITQSIEQLVYLVDELGIKKVLMPRPGCGNGGLKWEDVKPVIEPLLDDRFTVMERL